MSEDTRTCKTCGQTKPIGDYRVVGQKRYGGTYHDLQCRACMREARRARYHSDPEARALQIMYSIEAFIKRKHADSWHGSLVREGAAKLLAAKRCSYCETPNDGTFVFSLDHYVPLALGGAHTLDNLRPCCEPCNRAKHDLPPEVFRAWMDGLLFRLAWLRAQ